MLNLWIKSERRIKKNAVDGQRSNTPKIENKLHEMDNNHTIPNP